jgi:hypothetical protein
VVIYDGDSDFSLMIVPYRKNRGLKSEIWASYFSEINEKALFLIAFSYFQALKPKKGVDR